MVHLISSSNAILGNKSRGVSDGYHTEPGSPVWIVIPITFADRWPQ